MAQISYGSITIIDVTDVGQFSVYPKANAAKTQVYSPDADSYMPNWDVSDGGTAVTITPVAYYAGRNVSTTATYTWKRRVVGGSEANLITGETVSNGSLVISKNILADIDGGIITYVCTAHYTIDDINLEAIGQIDFSLVKQGSNAKIAKINGNNIFKIKSDGTFDNTSIVLTANVQNANISAWKYEKIGDANADANGYVVYPNSTAATTLTINSTDAPVVAARTGNGTIKIKLVTTDSDTYDIFTITILKDGLDAQSSIAAVLSNEVQMIPADDNGEISGATTTGTFQTITGISSQLTIYEQGVDETSTWTITKTPSSGITLVANQANYLATLATIDIAAESEKVVFSCSKTGFPTFTKEFNIVKIKAGADGITPIIYSLQSSSLIVNEKYTYDDTGALISTTRDPAVVTFSAYQQQGNNAKTAYSGRIQFYVNGSNSISNTYNINTSSREYSFSQNTGTTKVKAVLYAAGGNSIELDSQTVVVINDGSKGIQGQRGPAGIDGVNLILTNETDVIPCDVSGHPISNYTENSTNYFKINIPFDGYQGITKKATTVSAPELNKTTWGTSANIVPVTTNATTSAAGSVIYKIPVTATVPENGTISLTFSVAAESGNVQMTKIYSWTRSKAAANGANAVILTAVTPDGDVFENGEGTLTIKGILYDGPGEVSGITYTYYKYNTSAIPPSYVQIQSTTQTDPMYLVTQNGKTVLMVNGTAIDGFGSFKIAVTYNNNNYEQFVSLIDKTDPLQVSVHSTIGTQIKNAQGIGCLYARVIRNGEEIDPVPTNIVASITNPTSPNNGDYFIKLTAPNPPSSGTFTDNETWRGSAKLMKYNGSTWVEQQQQCTYEWKYRDANNMPLSTNDQKPATSGQFVYIDGTLIQNKITADVKVTLNGSN